MEVSPVISAPKERVKVEYGFWMFVATTFYSSFIPGWLYEKVVLAQPQGFIKSILLKFLGLILKGLGLGHPDKGGGLIGTAVAAINIIIVGEIWGYGYVFPLCAAVITFILGWPACHFAAKEIYAKYGQRTKHDGKSTRCDYNLLSIDEYHAMMLIWGMDRLVMMWLGFNSREDILFELLLDFILFRYWDTKKPKWVKRIESRFSSAFGVMIDDTLIAMQIIIIICFAWGIAYYII
ncbi:MAG: phosphatidylglycerophosphatase A [Patescibacteria group bacterium]|jgi:phosphatidylglycerophosphatase A